jgi:diguanylate cyclase (GGDEF)-like protein
MKRLFPAIAAIFGWSCFAWAAAPPALTTLRAVRALSNAEASQALPVAFEATVTYFPGYSGLLFVQDGDQAIFVYLTADAKLLAGDRVLVRGKTQASFRPIVIPDSVTLLHHGDLPKAVRATFNDLISPQFDCMLVKVHAVVRTAELGWSPEVRITYLQLLTDGGYIDAMVDSSDPNVLQGLLDAEVEVTGIAGGKFDPKMQQAGVILHVASMANVNVLKRASANPWSLPVTPMDKVFSAYHVQDQTQRVKVHGSITYYEPGTAVVLQDGTKSLWIETPERSPLQIGDIADATGFPDAHNGFLSLTHGEIQDSQIQAPIQPAPATWQQLALWSANKPDGQLYDLVSIEGQVVTAIRGAVQDEYVLLADGQLFSAIYRHPDAASRLPLSEMKKISVGSRIRVTGICKIEGTNPYNITQEAPFNILLRSFDDIAVVAGPTSLNIRNLLLAVCGLILVLFAALAKGWTLERKVRRQTAVLAEIEQRRSHILEDINGSRPLAEIIEEIVALASFKFHDAPCWCQIAGGALLGKSPPELAAFRVVHHEIPARSGPPLGAVFAAFGPRDRPSAVESETLSMAAGLATLAVETRRLYNDLRHRSEFDLLTDIHNRFSLEKHLDAQIAEARGNAEIFGLIYIDLDEFKQVNDEYGHHIGDLYLQEVARRMKQQLRSHDLLARLGGDEFAALLPMVRSRAGVEEIAQRLEHCFAEPFQVGENRIEGSASFGIALYPENGVSRDSLLSVADASMYVAKNAKRPAEADLAVSVSLPAKN